MTDDNLKGIIQNLDAELSGEEGLLGIYESKTQEPDHFIKADKTGLLLCALSLLKAAEKFEDLESNGSLRLEIPNQDLWLEENSEIVFDHIKPIFKGQSVPDAIVRKETFGDKATAYGCISIFIFLLISMIVGAVVIVQNLFS